jgi:photosystem II stability/assembly factor-like uncharacterized protein
MSELFHTVDQGQTWETIPYQQIKTSHQSGPVQFTADPLVRYAIDVTQRPAPRKSVDGGISWSASISNPTQGQAEAIIASALPPATGSAALDDGRVLVSDPDKVYYSGDGGATFAVAYDSLGAGTYMGGAFFDGQDVYVGIKQGLLISSNGGPFSMVGGRKPSTEIPAWLGR